MSSRASEARRGICAPKVLRNLSYMAQGLSPVSGKVFPLRIHSGNQKVLLVSVPVFQLLFPGNSTVYIVCMLKIYEFVNVVFFVNPSTSPLWCSYRRRGRLEVTPI